MFLDRLTSRAAALVLAAVFACGLLLEGIALALRAQDPAFVFLAKAGPAQWIRHGRPMEMALLPLGTDTTGFRVPLRIEAVLPESRLRFRALARAEVMIDGTSIFSERSVPANWKQWREVDLAPHLSPGDHVLTIVVRRDNGPPFLQAACAALRLATGPAWEASRDGVAWTAAATADRIAPVPGSRAFPRTDRALGSVALWLAPIFLLAAGARWAHLRGRIPAGWRRYAERAPAVVRAGLFAALAVLGLNAILRVPAWFGFDVVGHMEFIHYIVEKGRLPLAHEGWKMNEAPLFHLISSLPYRFIYTHLTVDQNVIAMRVIPLLCGLGQAEIALRTLRLVFPGRTHAQLLGAAVCGLLPMNLYLSFFPSNQPLVGLWSALAVYLTLRHLLDARPATRWAAPLLIGLCLGLAALSKVTGLLAAPGALLGIALAAGRRPGGRLRLLVEPAIALAAMLAVCGWFFVRNQLALGTPFSVGFSESLDTVWRQDPGFRAPGQLLTFGEALWHPVSAGFVGFWDSLYSTFWSDGFISAGQVPPGYVYDATAGSRPSPVPPWDFRFLGAATLLSLGPATLMLMGGIRAVARPTVGIERGTLLCLFWIGSHLAGMSYLYLTLPMVSAGKAAYLLNVLPCFGVLLGQGLAMIERRPVLDALATGTVAAWGVASYAAFFVR